MKTLKTTIVNMPQPAEHVTNHSRITDHIVVGSDLCKGGSCPVHSHVFGQMHIAAEIDLETEHDEPVTPRLEAYIRLPVPDHQAPSQVQLQIGAYVMHKFVQQNKNIYVHCRNGHGRAPTFVAAYLIQYEGFDVTAAVAYVKNKRPEIHLELVQMQTLEQFQNSVRANHK